MNEIGLEQLGLNGAGPSRERLQEAMRYLRERNRYILDKPVERRPNARPHLLTLIAEQIRREREMRDAMQQHGGSFTQDESEA